MRVEERRPRQPVTWLSQVLELFEQKGQVTSNELAAVVGKALGGDAVTRCRQVGLPVKAVGLVPGSEKKKLYALDAVEIWSALEESIQQQNRYVKLLNLVDEGKRPSFTNAVAWVTHLRKLAQETAESKDADRPECDPIVE